MKQYNAIKEKHPDALLLFRVGDFYETFGEDAVRAARILNIVQTYRNNGGDQTELAGFPHHSLNTYLPKLVRAGCRVAICDQLEDPKQTKTIVKRGVTELVTPGVSLNDEVLTGKRNNFLCSIHIQRDGYGVAFLDISTGEFLVGQGDSLLADKWIQNYEPSEILFSKQHRAAIMNEGGNRIEYSKGQEVNFYEIPVHYLQDWVFQPDYTTEKLHGHFGVASLKGYGVDHMSIGNIAAGAILHYLDETHHSKLAHITSIQRMEPDEFVWMDRFTIRNLELQYSPHPGAVTLIETLDETLTAMGGRLLSRWMVLPLKDRARIEARHEVLNYWIENPEKHERLRDLLRGMADLERLIGKVAAGKVCPREVVQLLTSLNVLDEVKEIAEQSSTPSLIVLGDELHACKLLRRRIEETLDPAAPVNILKGNCIKPGFHEELDGLRDLAHNGQRLLDDMLARETEATGIASLKIASNNVFGYYIEVRNAHKDKVPEHWTRKQTLVNAERYITEELKDYENKILSAQDKITTLEQALFEELVREILPFVRPVQRNAAVVGQLDVLQGFAEVSRREHYRKPVMNDGYELTYKEGRHPVIEKMLSVDAPYIANDLHLDREQQQIIMITGPNMSGKSAILRQTALIVLMAQIGCYVPASEAHIGVVDKIFTRVGASDNISMGESTFMTEMNESASILNNLSDRSLVLLDEIGRGTSTYDGISIAWAITEFLHEHPARARVLFATHYHELNDMTEQFPRIRNHTVQVKELEDRVLFMRKLIPGGSEHSFGIYVARMAGMPQSVVRRASKMLEQLEASSSRESHKGTLKKVAREDVQLSFFQMDDPVLEEIRDDINALDIDTLTPVEALMKLAEIKKLLLPNTGKQTG